MCEDTELTTPPLETWRKVLIVALTVFGGASAGTGLAFTVASGRVEPLLAAAFAVTLLLIVGVHVAEPARDVPEEVEQ